MACHGVRIGDTCPVAAPPTFASIQEYASRRADVGFWWPYVDEILERPGLANARREPVVAGFDATYPTFLYGDVVVKLFGYARAWRESHAAERGAQALVATDPEIVAPSLLSDGCLCDDVDAPWPYLITTRMSGVASLRAELSAFGRCRAGQAGPAGARAASVRRRNARGLVGAERGAAAEQSSLPPHLIAQIDDYLERLGPFDCVFVHGDLVANHVYVVNDRLTGIIDWGDAMVTDRHYEIIQLYRDMFGCDKALLRVFLDAWDWPVGKEFPSHALGLALYRQEVGLAQHPRWTSSSPSQLGSRYETSAG